MIHILLSALEDNKRFTAASHILKYKRGISEKRFISNMKHEHVAFRSFEF